VHLSENMQPGLSDIASIANANGSEVTVSSHNVCLFNDVDW
jgi:hypothetical protein